MSTKLLRSFKDTPPAGLLGECRYIKQLALHNSKCYTWTLM